MPTNGRSHANGRSRGRSTYLEAEVSGRSSGGEAFIETYKQEILLSEVDKLQTYIQTDKPIYKAGQTGISL